MVKVTIIVPVYNCEKYLRRCIDSLINQSLKDIEIILINDGSTDNSLFICEEYQRLDNRIRVVNKKNGGVSSARNIGIENASGEFIGFVDSDDYIEKTMFENMYRKMKCTVSDLCLCNFILHQREHELRVTNCIKSEILFEDEVTNKLISNIICPDKINSKQKMTAFRGPVMYLYKKSILKSKKITFSEDLVIGEDFLFNLQYMYNCRKVCIDSGYYYHYCINTTSATRRYRNNWWIEHENLINQLEKIIKLNNNIDIFKQQLCVMKFHYFIATIANEVHRDNNKSFKEKIQSLKNIKKNQIIQSCFKEYSKREDTIFNRLYFNIFRYCPVTILYGIFKIYLYLDFTE